MIEVLDVILIGTCGVVVFALFYCLLCCGEFVVCVFSYICVFVVCVGELFVECVCYLCGIICVLCPDLISVFYFMYSGSSLHVECILPCGMFFCLREE